MFQYDKTLIKIKKRNRTGVLPDIFTFENGEKMVLPDQWEMRRREIQKNVIDIQYGTLPPKPDVLDVELLGEIDEFSVYRVVAGTREKTLSFIINIVKPDGNGPFPVIIDGDLCFPHTHDQELYSTIREQGIVLVLFNRLELAPDRNTDRTGALYDIYPEYSFGAIGAWAWGYSRCVDVMEKLSFVNPKLISFTGHSRGGKAAMLAGAVDERVVVVNPNNSGAGGSGCYRVEMEAYTEDGELLRNEKLSDILEVFPYWFGPELKKYVNQELMLPFDQHMMKALVAPRYFLSSEAASDIWANPTGTYETNQAAKELFTFLGVPSHLIWYYRRGYHKHTISDYQMLCEVLLHVKTGKALNKNFFRLPFEEGEHENIW